MKSAKRIRILFEILLCFLALLLGLLGIHYFITRFLNFSQEDSFFILTPVFIIVSPAVFYGYYVGYKRHYCEASSISSLSKVSSEKVKTSEIVRIALLVSVIMIFTILGLYHLVYKEAHYLGIIHIGIGALISIPLSKTLHGFIKAKEEHPVVKQ